jgi:large subunit ribosomal protein L1
MPTPKMGTVTTDVAKAVKSAKAGVVSFKVDKTGIIHAGIGKVSFSVEALIDNIRSLLMSIGDARPEGLKGKYFKSAYLTSTQGQSVLIDLSTVDPNSPKFMLDRLAAEKLGFQK